MEMTKHWACLTHGVLAGAVEAASHVLGGCLVESWRNGPRIEG